MAISSKRKLLVIGLDCAAPQLVFDKFREHLPNLNTLMSRGLYAEMESTVPPITCPAWMSMLTGKDPGVLGVYGFRNRKNYSYDQLEIANSSHFREKKIWDTLAEANKKVILVGIPVTYPVQPVNGYMVSCFMTPSPKSEYAYPPSLKTEIEELVGNYPFDVEAFRLHDRDSLLQEILDGASKRFTVIKKLIKEKDWDFFMFVEMALDRLHHGFWKYFDEKHPKYEADTKWQNAVLSGYRHIDSLIGELLELLDDKTEVMVVSDHGARPMEGGICINDWLIKEGYLVLEDPIDEVTPFAKVKVDWPKTSAWSEGGYYGRLFINLKDREPDGLVEKTNYESLRDELISKITKIDDGRGRKIGTRIFKPEEIYETCNGIPPDLIIYFGNLAWRSIGSVGNENIQVFENDTGQDDANHSQYGIFISSIKDKGIGRKVSIYDLPNIFLKPYNLSL